MKKFNLIGILFITLVLAFNSSCKKDDDNDDGIGLNGNCFASWKVDGTDYSSENMVGCLYLDSTLNLATNLTGGEFFLQIDPIGSTGTYVADVTNSDLSVVMLLTLTNGTQIGILNGSVVVTELSNSKAKGTFSGNFFDITDLNQAPVFSVTNGTFEASF